MFKKFSDELIKGSLVLFISFNIFNFLNYLFHFIGARFLGPIDYGILATLMSLVYIFNVPSETIQTITSRYATKFSGDNQKGLLKNLTVRALKRFFMMGLICFIIYLAVSPLISKFLFIDLKLIALTGLVLFGIFLMPVSRGILQGTKKFNALGINYIAESLVKVVLALILILIGWRVYGAMGATIAGVFFAFAISFVSLKKIFKDKQTKEKIKGIYSYSLPVLLTISAIMILLSVDIILAKRFFPEELVGKYAVVSMLSKIIFFGTWPISKTMFPLVSERSDKKKGSQDLLSKSLIIVFFGGLFVVGVYALFPELIIKILFGAQYVEMAGILAYTSMSMLLLSLTNIFALYNLSTKKKNLNYLIVAGVIAQVVFLFLFHSTISQFVDVLVFTNLALLFALAIASFKKKR